jgi:hypothetical protein
MVPTVKRHPHRPSSGLRISICQAPSSAATRKVRKCNPVVKEREAVAAVHGSFLGLRERRGGRLKLLEVGGERRDILVIQLLGEQRHRRRTVPPETLPPHL